MPVSNRPTPYRSLLNTIPTRVSHTHFSLRCCPLIPCLGPLLPFFCDTTLQFFLSAPTSGITADYCMPHGRSHWQPRHARRHQHLALRRHFPAPAFSEAPNHLPLTIATQTRRAGHNKNHLRIFASEAGSRPWVHRRGHWRPRLHRPPGCSPFGSSRGAGVAAGAGAAPRLACLLRQPWLLWSPRVALVLACRPGR